MTPSIYEFTVEDYLQLQESGNGRLIYGNDWPFNVSIFKSLKSRYLAVKQMWDTIETITSQTGISASDTLDVLLGYYEIFTDIATDIENGVISEEDITEMINTIDGE